jgi:hypothetical protein
VQVHIRPLGPGMVQQIQSRCGDCGGSGYSSIPSECRAACLFLMAAWPCLARTAVCLAMRLLDWLQPTASCSEACAGKSKVCLYRYHAPEEGKHSMAKHREHIECIVIALSLSPHVRWLMLLSACLAPPCRDCCRRPLHQLQWQLPGEREEDL